MNSSFVQALLKFFLSKTGPFIASGIAWMVSHLILALGIAAFIDPAQLQQIQEGLTTGANTFAMALVAALYAWVFKKQNDNVAILKEQINLSPQATPSLDTDTGRIGAATLAAVAKITGIHPETAARSLDNK